MRIYKEEIRPGPSVVRADSTKRRWPRRTTTSTATAWRSSPATATPPAISRRRVDVGMVGINVPIPVPLAYYTFGGWKRSGFGDLNQHGPDLVRFTPRPRPSPPLALGRWRRRQLRHSDHGLMGTCPRGALRAPGAG
ncbi:hypothetical protein [Azospirillum sp. B2RO_4]|uniref:hypothetical protein n=1 Tax=Azospirillum sp. B2RO_4 TaxID=3027796 RepID=UPI003DA99CEE